MNKYIKILYRVTKKDGSRYSTWSMLIDEYGFLTTNDVTENGKIIIDKSKLNDKVRKDLLRIRFNTKIKNVDVFIDGEKYDVC